MARKLKYRPAMKSGLIGLFVLATWGSNAAATAGVAQDGRPTFRASTDLVTVAATVRTRRGRPVVNLKAERLPAARHREAAHDHRFQIRAAPVSVALLVDFSGSMEVGERRGAARDTASHIVNFLKPDVDQAGLYVFDQKLREVQALAPAPGDIVAQLESMSRPFGATSLFDAIAETGRVLAGTGGQRRAVIALTDGADNASRLTAAEVSGIASSIDVPVYIVVIVSPLDRDGTNDDRRSTADGRAARRPARRSRALDGRRNLCGGVGRRSRVNAAPADRHGASSALS